MRRVAAWLTAALALLLAAGGAAAQARWGADYFPNVELVTHEGKTVRFYDDLLKGKSVAINVIFTECGDTCPLQTAKMRELQRVLGERVGRDIFFYSISIDTQRDTPAVLKAYAEKFGIGPGWLFLTGKDENVKAALRKLGLASGKDPASLEAHRTSLMVGNEPSGQWMRNSSLDNPRFLAATLETFLGWSAAPSRPAYVQAKPIDITHGQFVFQNGCASCHTIGGGDKIGPDLLGVTQRRPRDWLTRFILVPNELIAAGDPVATALFHQYKRVPMPNLGLARDEVDDVLAYLDQRAAAHDTKAKAAAASRP
jgi:protein SCO1